MAVATTRVGMITLRPLTQGNRMAEIVLSLYVALVAAQALMAMVRFKSPVVSAIGMIAYLSPIPAIWLAYRYLRGVPDYRRFVRLYVALALLVALSIVLDKLGVQMRVLEEVGEGLIIYDRTVGLLSAHTGMMRSPEVAAWHLGTAACLLVVLAVAWRRPGSLVVTPVVVISLLVIATLTGRRKVIIVFALFAVVYMMLLLYFRQRSGTRAMFVAVLGALLVGGATLLFAPDQSTLDPYLGRGRTVFADATDRFKVLGLESMLWAINQAGVWGLGAGAASQGVQHFGGASAQVRGAAEGGLGKIIVELGVPGLLLIVLAAGYVLRSIRVALRRVAASGDVLLLRLNLGLLAFVVANVPVFVGASQIYGDPFVLFIIGTCMGFVFAGPRLIELQARRRQQMAAAVPPQPAAVRPFAPRLQLR
jgi:hypothetical protein